MSDTTAMERAAGQAGQTAAIALQVIVMAAQALREHQEREAARAAAAPPPSPRARTHRPRRRRAIRSAIRTATGTPRWSGTAWSRPPSPMPW